MKKLSAFTILLLVTNVLTFSILIWGCDHDDRDDSKGGNRKMGIKSASSSTCTPNCYPVPDACDTLKGFNLGLATEMISNYRKNHWQMINKYCRPFSGFPNSVPQDTVDARSVWFDLDTLKAFINTIEITACRNSCPNLKLGVRIYYAEYPGADTMVNYGLDPSLAHMHTVLMMPTYQDNTSQLNMDFDPYAISCPLGNTPSLFDTLHPFLVLSPSSSVTARNHGGLAPPPFKVVDCWNSAISGTLFMMYVDSVNDGLRSSNFVVRNQ
jgi:hypothetical protein